MPQNTTFKVSKRGVEPVEVNFTAPESLDDPRWAELIAEGKDAQKEINNLATQNLIIKIQSGARGKLEEGQEAVQAYVDSYKFGSRAAGSGGGKRKAPRIEADAAKKAKFSKEQIEMLRAAGVEIEEAAAA
jgi:hypothetical protein